MKLNPSAWYMKKKVWIAVLTAASQVVAAALGKPDVGEKILVVGTVLIGALGLEDMGKAAKLPSVPPPPPGDAP